MNNSSDNVFEGARHDRGDFQISNFMIRQDKTLATQSRPQGDGFFTDADDSKAMELHCTYRSQKEEIHYLRKQIANAYLRELKLLNEKYSLEKSFAELRMAIDERQNEAVTSALNEMIRRKVDLEENIKLANELKVVESDRYLFASSLLGLLGEHGACPLLTSASAISNSLKRLHDELQWKIRASNDKIREMGSKLNNQDRSELYLEEKLGSHILINQEAISRSAVPINPVNFVERPTFLADGRQPQQSHSIPTVEFALTPDRQELQAEKDFLMPPDERANMTSSHEEGPGIDDFQIIGNPIPGEMILGCGFPVRGTSLCIFRWVRHLDDGTRQYIEGATNPEYVITADDVDKLIAVECIPMDEYGRQGELVNLFANDQNKIQCDVGMQEEIDNYMSVGEAFFDILLLADASEDWEPSSLLLRRSGYQIKSKNDETLLIGEKFSKEFSLKIPVGLSTQVVLVCSDGSSHPLSASNVRMRDVLVLTMRHFQKKALDDRRKGRVLFRT